VKAIIITTPGGPEVLELQEVADPQAGKGELLVRIKAAGLNRADLLQRQGGYAPPPGAPDILGLEMSGVIETVGEGVEGWQVGDKVCALLGGGGYAEKVVIPADMAIPVPEGMSFEEAACLPEAGLTAFMNLFVLGELPLKIENNAKCVLIHAGGSGIGTAAIQLAKAAGAIVLVTAGSEDKLERCAELGADYGLNYKEQANFSEWVKEVTDGQGVNVILDFIGAPYLAENLLSLGMHGRLILIGQLGGRKAEVDLGLIMTRRLHITGTTIRSRTGEEKIDLTKRFGTFAKPLLESGDLRPVLDRTFDLSQAAEAHTYMASNQSFGKIVLTVP
jgi:tumor protein p53-inducible protein 3